MLILVADRLDRFHFIVYRGWNRRRFAMEGMISERITCFKPGKPTIREDRHWKLSIFRYFPLIFDSFKP